MPPAHARSRLAVALLTILALALSGGAPAIDAQTGGTLVIGLDQEPPTLDPHASPSAVTYQIIASVTESLLYKRPGRQARAVARRVVDDVQRRARRHVQAAAGREVPRRHAVQRRRGEVQLRPHRRSEVQGRAARAPQLAGYAGSKVLDEFTVQVTLRDALRAVPDLRRGRHAQHGVAQGRARVGRPGAHAAGRQRRRS